MADILLNNGDIVVSNGDIVICSDDNDILQQASNNIGTIIGSNVFHPNIGNPALNERMKHTEQYIDIIKDGCLQAIELDDRIDTVDDINITLSSNNSCLVSFSITTIYGDTIDSQCSITIGGNYA